MTRVCAFIKAVCTAMFTIHQARGKDDIKKWARKAERQGKPVFGIKGVGSQFYHHTLIYCRMFPLIICMLSWRVSPNHCSIVGLNLNTMASILSGQAGKRN